MARTDGFVKIPNWLIDDSDLNGPELNVYIVLLRFRSPKTGKCWPGMATIADRARISKRAVIRAIGVLEERNVIQVTRRSTPTDNRPNVYTVALPTEEARHIFASSEQSARGTRIPKRPPRKKKEASVPSDSESPVLDAPDSSDESSDSQSLGSDSVDVGVVTPSHPNKNNLKKINEQDMTLTFVESESELFSFDIPDSDKATEKQVMYLRDLAIHLAYGSTGGIPSEAQLNRWRKLTRDDAKVQIKGYLKALGRPDGEDTYYPQAGDPEYDALSTAGQAFADSSGDPDSVYDYTKHA